MMYVGWLVQLHLYTTIKYTMRLENLYTPPQDGDKNPFEDRYPIPWTPL
jgi:hypothetical protein